MDISACSAQITPLVKEPIDFCPVGSQLSDFLISLLASAIIEARRSNVAEIGFPHDPQTGLTLHELLVALYHTTATYDDLLKKLRKRVEDLRVYLNETCQGTEQSILLHFSRLLRLRLIVFTFNDNKLVEIKLEQSPNALLTASIYQSLVDEHLDYGLLYSPTHCMAFKCGQVKTSLIVTESSFRCDLCCLDNKRVEDMFSIGACSLCFRCVVARGAELSCPRCQRSLESDEQQLLEVAELTLKIGLAGVCLGPGLVEDQAFYQEGFITVEDPDCCSAIYKGIKLTCKKCIQLVNSLLPRGQSQRLCNDCIDTVVHRIKTCDSDDPASGKQCNGCTRSFTITKFVTSAEHFGRQCSYCRICANHTQGYCPDCEADLRLPTEFELKLAPCKLCLDSSEVCIYKKCAHIVCATIAESSPDSRPCGEESPFIKMKLMRRIRLKRR
jgi:hypothetical protein